MLRSRRRVERYGVDGADVRMMMMMATSGKTRQKERKRKRESQRMIMSQQVRAARASE